MTTFELEKKFSDYADKYIYSEEAEIIPINGKLNRTYGDKKLIFDGCHIVYVEEKAASYLHSDMVIEIIQNIILSPDDPKFLGWFFNIHYDLMLYGYYDEKNNGTPTKVYRIDWKPFRSYMLEMLEKNGRIFKFGITNKNYGVTLNLYYPWKLLCTSKTVDLICNNLNKNEPQQELF